MSTVDIEKALQSDDAATLGQLLNDYRQRRHVNDVLRECKDSGEPGDIIRRGYAEAALAMMKDDPVVSALDALRIERRVFELAKDEQWHKMMEAREEGASWEEIAAALDIISNHAAKIARDWYVMRITALEKDMSADKLARARVVIDDAADPVAGEPVVDDPPADGES